MVEVVDVWNMALGTIGARAKLTTTTDNSREAELCALFYTKVRNKVMASAYWSQLRFTSRLSLVASRLDESVDWQDGDPTPGWRYAFALPTAHLRPRYLIGFEPFEFGHIFTERVLMTNCEFPILVYTKLMEDPDDWGGDLLDLIVATLALEICYPLTKSAGEYESALKRWQMIYTTSMVGMANAEMMPQLETQPDWITIREGLTTAPLRYIYPVEQLAYAIHPA